MKRDWKIPVQDKSSHGDHDYQRSLFFWLFYSWMENSLYLQPFKCQDGDDDHKMTEKVKVAPNRDGVIKSPEKKAQEHVIHEDFGH